MYSREYFYNIRKSINKNIEQELEQELIEKINNIDKLLFKDKYNNWRSKNQPSLIKKKLSEIDKIKNELNLLLNKITTKNFETISVKIIKIYSDNDITDYLIDILFNKSVMQPFFCPFYVKLLKLLKNNDIIKLINIKISEYIKISQEDLVKNNKDLSYSEFCENNSKKIFKMGYSQFVGELFLNNLLEYMVIINNINLFIDNLNNILSNNKNIEFLEDTIICLDKLLRTVKNNFKKDDIDKINLYLTVFIKNENLSKRFKFKLMDLKDYINS